MPDPTDRDARWRANVSAIGQFAALVSVIALSVAGRSGAQVPTTGPDRPTTTSRNRAALQSGAVPSTLRPATPLPPTTLPPTTLPTTLPPTTLPPEVRDPAALVPGDADRPKPAYVDSPQGARQKAAAYAYIWADATNPAFALSYRGKLTVPSDNPVALGRAIDTSDFGELDCTAYMSQALRASGFPYTKTWWYRASPKTSSTSWVRASGPDGLTAVFLKSGLMRSVNPLGTSLGQPPPPGIQLGDLVVWNLDGRKPTFIDHQLMVTEVTGAGSTWHDIRVSYHTYDHRNRALDEYQDYVALDFPKARLYVFHVNYSS